MITCTTKPPEEYVVTLPSGYTCGLWDTYGHDPELFCFISRTSPSMFMYEPGFDDVNPGIKVVEVPGQGLLIDTMDQKVRGMTVREIQHRYNPIEMFELFSNVSIEHLSCVGVVEEFLAIMSMRLFQFKRHHRGHLQFEGDVQRIQFCSSLTVSEGEELDSFISGMRTLMNKEEIG